MSAIPAKAAAGLLSCDGSTIYSLEKGSSASANGTLNALTTSTVSGSSVTATAVSSIPAGGGANALGITTGGTRLRGRSDDNRRQQRGYPSL